jgi:diacylglycerol kinase family enzyme
MQTNCPVCETELETKGGLLTCACGFIARNVYQVERLRTKISTAARIAASRARIAKMHAEQDVAWHTTGKGEA